MKALWLDAANFNQSECFLSVLHNSKNCLLYRIQIPILSKSNIKNPLDSDVAEIIISPNITTQKVRFLMQEKIDRKWVRLEIAKMI